MKTIYYITRTLPGGNTGGSLIRQGTVKYLRESGYKVIVVSLSSEDREDKDTICIKGVTSRWMTMFNQLLFYFGFINDYLQPWAKRVFEALKEKVTQNDVVVATSGGELGTLMAARKLKDFTGCRIVYNLHDPIDYTTIDGEFSFIGTVKMRSRDAAESDVFQAADAIVTSSEYYADALRRKYPLMNIRFSCHHFGYIEDLMVSEEKSGKVGRVNVVYGGNMGPLQGPTILIELARHFPEQDFTFVGDLSYNGDDLPKNVIIKGKMPYRDYIAYLSEKADIGFFSLVGNVSKLCVPSKLYEYINVGLPILAAIDGDAKTIVNNHGFGIATDYSVDSLSRALNMLLMPGELERIRTNVLSERNQWAMKSTIAELISVLENDDNREI